MPTDYELEAGVRCTASFTRDDGKRTYEHAVLRYTHAKGGVLEVPMEEFWNNQLYSVSATTRDAQIFIPILDYRAGDFTEKQRINTFHFNEMLLSYHGSPPEEILLDRIEISIERFGAFIGNFPVAKKVRDQKHYDLNCTKEDMYVVDLPQWAAKTWIECGFQITDIAGGSYEVHPSHKLIIDLEEPVTYDQFLHKAKALSTFWEFLMHRPMHPGQMIYRSKSHGMLVRHLFKDIPDVATGVAWAQTGVLQSNWEEFAPYLDKLINRWIGLDHGSAWMDNLTRLIQYRELPHDFRFFMAYTVLQGFGEELGKGRPLITKGKEEVRVWEDYEVYWHHALFPLSEPAKDYVNRMVLTRHHFAHLSKANLDILRSFEEFSGAYFRLMIVLKVMFMDTSGIPMKTWKKVLEQWAIRVQLALHPYFKTTPS
ncbi:MAG: hypothetical protein QM724_05335 [Flavobacteriales bacterium]